MCIALNTTCHCHLMAPIDLIDPTLNEFFSRECPVHCWSGLGDDLGEEDSKGNPRGIVESLAEMDGKEAKVEEMLGS